MTDKTSQPTSANKRTSDSYKSSSANEDRSEPSGSNSTQTSGSKTVGPKRDTSCELEDALEKFSVAEANGKIRGLSNSGNDCSFNAPLKVVFSLWLYFDKGEKGLYKVLQKLWEELVKKPYDLADPDSPESVINYMNGIPGFTESCKNVMGEYNVKGILEFIMQESETIAEKFRCYFIRRKTCNECGYWEPPDPPGNTMTVIDIPLEDNDVSVDVCVERFFSPTECEDDCPCCRKRTKCTITTELNLDRPAEFLCLVPKRDRPPLPPQMAHLRFGERPLKLNGIKSEKKVQQDAALLAVVSVETNNETGRLHFRAFTKNGDKTWWEHNDAEVSKDNGAKVSESTVYMAFYTLINDDAEGSSVAAQQVEDGDPTVVNGQPDDNDHDDATHH